MPEPSPQVGRFMDDILDRRPNYDSVEQAARKVRENVEGYGVIFDEHMVADLEEAARRVQENEQDVEILRKRSIISQRERWYEGPGGSDLHWPPLYRYLLENKGWAKATIESIDEASSEVVSLLDNPMRDQFRCRGLVVGYVQSGKTANMTAVIAKAVDAGYNLVILLSSVTKKLRKQTQDRIEKDVVNRHRHLWQLHTTSEIEGDFSRPANRSFTMPSEGRAQLLVMKKEVHRLRALRDTIDQTQAFVRRNLKVLLIDDECDQASVNSSTGDFDISRINGSIRRVLAKLPAVSYVGYTATPFANVFINPFPVNDEELDDLYPSDFITSLVKPEGYFGAVEVFGRDSADEEDDGRDMLRVIEEDEPERLQTLKNDEKETFRPSMTASLEAAVMWFLAACSIRRSRGQSDQHMTMLVHSSQYVAQHEYMSELLEEWVNQHRADIEQGRGEVGRRFESVFLEEKGRTGLAGTPPIRESLETVQEHLPAVFDSLRYPVENGESEKRIDYDNGPITCIAVGGTVLSRGLTLEGLVVSFFLRTSRQYDTLLQMGRWFGFRPGYDDLPRLWTTADLISKFRSLAVIEEEIREEIEAYRRLDKTPMELAMRVRSIPGMAITSAAKMRYAHRTSMTYDGQHVQTIRFNHRDADFVRGNWIAASRLLDSCLEKAESREDGERGSLLRGISARLVRSFVLETQISEEHMNLKREHLLSYLDSIAVQQPKWNVALIQPASSTVSSRNLGRFGTVKTIRRARLKTSPDHYADIKALMSKKDILIDADPDLVAESDAGSDWRSFKALRPTVPLLLLYPIDADSQPRKPDGQRVALDAVGDVIGFGMVFPGERDRAGGYFSVELDAPSTDQYQDDPLAELGEDAGLPNE